MLIQNAYVFIDKAYHQVDVQTDKDKIIAIGSNLIDKDVIDATGQYLFAGMIDTHIHGGFTKSFSHKSTENSREETEIAIRDILRELPKHGVTACFPTIGGTSDVASLQETVRLIRDVRKNVEGATPIRIHFEGPYINPERHASFDPSCATVPSIEHTMAMTDHDLSDIGIICVAPELPGALDWIRWITAQNVHAEVCYTMADSQLIHEAAMCGVSQASHLYNGYEAMHQRVNGPVVAILNEDKINAQINCDGYHVASEWVKLAIRTKGLNHIYGITDMGTNSGLPEGEYTIGKKQIIVKDGLITDINGTIQHGSLTWNEMMHAAKHKIGLSMEEIGSLYGENPAKCLNISDRGKIEVGRKADLVLMDEEFQVIRTVLNGETYYRR